MEDSENFLAPRLDGRRFEDHRLPVNLLEDFTALEELIFEVAKKIYLSENPQRRRVPKGFTDGVSLKLSDIREGSTIANIVLASNIIVANVLTDIQSQSTSYLERARDEIIRVIGDAQMGKSNGSFLDKKQLNYFNRIGRNLQDGETMSFAKKDGGEAVLDKNVRKKILLSINEKVEYSDNISVNGFISALDKGQNTFTLDIDGNVINCDIDNNFYDVIWLGLTEYDNNTQVSIKATGIFNDQDRLIRIENIESMDVLDPFDVNIRIGQLTKLKDGWYEGYGKAPNKDRLTQFGEYFNSYYDINLPLPSIFPTVEGNIQLEWNLRTAGIILELFLKDFSADFLVSSIDESLDEEERLNLNEQSDWLFLNEKVKSLSNG